MIETKEEYEKITHLIHPDLLETIEALQKAVRANRAFFPDARDEWDFVDPAPAEWFALQDALDALPDWVTENG